MLQSYDHAKLPRSVHVSSEVLLSLTSVQVARSVCALRKIVFFKRHETHRDRSTRRAVSQASDDENIQLSSHASRDVCSIVHDNVYVALSVRASRKIVFLKRRRKHFETGLRVELYHRLEHTRTYSDRSTRRAKPYFITFDYMRIARI